MMTKEEVVQHSIDRICRDWLTSREFVLSTSRDWHHAGARKQIILYLYNSVGCKPAEIARHTGLNRDTIVKCIQRSKQSEVSRSGD